MDLPILPQALQRSVIDSWKSTEFDANSSSSTNTPTPPPSRTPSTDYSPEAVEAEDRLNTPRDRMVSDEAVEPKLVVAEKDAEGQESILDVPTIDDCNKVICAYWGRLAEWEIGKELGKGSFSKVLKATRRTTFRTTGHDEVVKAIARRDVSSPDAWYNVCNEYKSLAKVGPHPNIACLTGCFQSQRYVYLFLEHAVGQELFACLRHWRQHRYSPVDMASVARVFWSVACALAHCHHHAICHRDVKPENIMVREDFTAKLVDFGFACPREDLRTQCVGSMPFIAPEFIRGTALDGALGDIWSLGVVMIELLFGAYSFSWSLGWDSKPEISIAECGAQLADAFDDPNTGLAQVRKAVGTSREFDGDGMLSRMLSANAAKRPSAKECRDAPWLDQYLKSDPSECST